MNNSRHDCPALRRRRRGEAAPSGKAAKWLHWKGKVWSIARFRLYPASRVSGRGPAGLARGKPKLFLGSSELWITYSKPSNNGPMNQPNILGRFVDSDWAGCQNSSRSTYSYVEWCCC
jgi:hypothetical protein